MTVCVCVQVYECVCVCVCVTSVCVGVYECVCVCVWDTSVWVCDECVCGSVCMCESLNLKQNEAQSTCEESTHKGVN